MGPSGVGVLYGRRELLESMPPFLGGGSMIRRVTLDGFEPPDRRRNSRPALRRSSPPSASAPLDYLDGVGLDAVTRHEQDLTRYAHEVLGELGDLRILGLPPEEKSAIVSFVFDGNRPHAHDIATARSAGRGDPRSGHHCACRCTNDSASTPPPGRVSTSTIHAKKSTSWPGRFNKSGKFSEDGPEDGPRAVAARTLCPGETLSGRTFGSCGNPWG